MLSLIPVKSPKYTTRFDVVNVVEKLVEDSVRDGDVIVITSKLISMSDGAEVDLRRVSVTEESRRLSKLHKLDPRLAEIIVRESDEILGGIDEFVLSIKRNILAPNAGVDKSNASHGKVLVYPKDVENTIRLIRDNIKFRTGVDVGVLVCDSRLMPMRKGTTSVALASVGLEGLVDMRGKRDLFGNKLKVTIRALADDLCSAAHILMGESNESVPIVIVRGLTKSYLKDRQYRFEDFAISKKSCVYFKSLGIN